jgi:uncharacterized membrane protein (UPF0127 family)
MFRTDLPPNRGMWFSLRPTQPVASSGCSTHAEPGHYLSPPRPGGVHRRQCARLSRPALPTYGPPPSQLVDSVLEFRGGTAAALGLQVGDTVEIRELSPKAP